MRKLLSIILCAAMVLSMLPAMALSTVQAATGTAYSYVAFSPATVIPKDNGTKGAWYNNGSVYVTNPGSANYIEMVADGYADAGAMHVHQDNVANNDMSLGMFLGGQPAGTYTVKMYVKGDLGLMGQTCKFYPYGCMEQVPNLHDTLGTTDVADWAEVSYTVDVASEFYYFIFSFSKYNWQTDFNVDNIQLINSSGVNVLGSGGNFYQMAEVTTNSNISGQWANTALLDTQKFSSAYSNTQAGVWTPMFPTGNPEGTFSAWNSEHYAEIVADGYADAGSLHLVSCPGNNTGLAIDAGMIPGQTYTLGFYAKGTVNTGKVMGMYANGDGVIIGNTASFLPGWNYYSHTFTAGMSQINIVAADWGWVDIYVDNITLKDASGKDLLAGCGDFYETRSTGEEEATEIPVSIADSYAGDFIWYNGNGYTATADMYIEVAAEGADDVGALHVYQKDGVAAAGDMWLNLRVGNIPVGSYTLQYKIKGPDLGNTDSGNSNNFYISKQNIQFDRFRNVAGTKTLNDWTEQSVVWDITSEQSTISLAVSKYVCGADYYLDNVKLIDANGNDVLQGAGNFCQVREEEPEVTEPDVTEPEPTIPPEIGASIPTQIASQDPQELYVWYNSNGYTCTDDMYIEIVEEGADDVGAMHVYQKDGVAAAADMRLKMHTGYIAAGKYTLKMKIKGSDLGNSDNNDACKFYVSSNDGVFPQIRNLAGSKTVADWTEFSQVVETTTGAFMFSLSISKYVSGADFYIDNLQLLDNNGNDMLGGSGNFCIVWEGEPEPVEGLLTLAGAANAYEAPDGVWSEMYPAGTPDNSSTWPVWDDSHYAEIVADGYRDRGALHLKSASYKNTAVAIGVNMVVGQTYTLGLWAKGTSNSGKVLAQYGNGDPIVIAASTALTSDWSYYECAFTAGMTQLNIMAPDWGATNIYIDHITLIGADGVDLLAGYGDFCEEQYRVEDPLHLENFENVNEADLAEVSGQVTLPGASDPALTINSQESETGKAMQATWDYDGINPSYLHRYENETWAAIFAQEAVNYRYLRLWINNPSHVSIDVTVLLSGEDTENYWNAAEMKLIRKDGTEIYGTPSDSAGYGQNSAISVPKQFAGWLSIPLNTENLLAAQGYTAVISDFAKVTDMALEFRKKATSGEGDSETYYYVVDDVCLSYNIAGEKQSTQDGNDYGSFDTSVKGQAQVQNVIFLIGDGMGFGALDVARLERPTLYMDMIVEKGGVAGQVATTNLFGEITDSAAGGTALATGFLTKNTVLGLTDDLEPIMNLGEYMKQLNKKLGLVSTTYVLDATPASFAAHTSARGNYTDIALDIMKLGVDVVQGGGRSYMTASVMDDNGVARSLTELAQVQYGYTYATNADQMDAVTSGKLWGIYEENNMPWVKYQTDATPTLAEMTAKTFQLLENENGFFAMIEGGQIDVAGHDNSPIDTRLETLAFDDAVKEAMDYVDAHPGTLLVITADHETGGVGVAQDGAISYYTTSHSAEQVPYFAYGTGAEYFEGLTVNTQINYAIRQATMGDTSVGASSVATEAQLTDTQVMDATVENGVITYTGAQQPAEFTLTDPDAAYAVVKYKTEATNLVGMIDQAKIQYASDGLWHISDVLSLSDDADHLFQPMSYIKGDTYNSIDLAGKQLQIDWIGFFDSYEKACAFQAHAALTGATPSGLNSLSMTLDTNLNLNFFVAADERSLENTQLILTVGDKTRNLSLADGALDPATGNYKLAAELAAAQMNEPVNYTLIVNGRQLESGSYSVRQYAEAILSGDFDDTVKTLVNQMLHYGAAAQVYFDVDPENLVNAGLMAGTDYQLPEAARPKITGSTADVKFYGASLLYHSEIALRFYFAGDLTQVSVTCGDQLLSPEIKDDLYYVQLDGITPAGLDDAVTVVVTGNGESMSIQYSPLDYVARMYANGSEALQNLLYAMYQYHIAAENYIAA